MKNLLEKSRTLNKLLQQASGHPVDLMEMARVLGNLINANIYIIGATGGILGYSLMDNYGCAALEVCCASNGAIAEARVEVLLQVPETALNMRAGGKVCTLDVMETGCAYEGLVTTIVPIIVSSQRQGALVLNKFGEQDFGYEDTILAEYGAMVIGLVVLRARSERIEEDARQKAAVQIAISALSYSEQEAINHIFAELNGKEALLIASKIADRAGITRSVIVNALRKFESAGVVETKSLGMKGTYIRVLNDNLLEELASRRGS